MDVSVADGVAYVADDFFWFQLIDVSDPTYPRLAKNYNIPGVANR